MAMKGLNFRVGATQHTDRAMSGVVKGLKGVRRAQQSVNRTNVSFMKGMNANRRIIQQVGMQVSDIGVQIAGGQSAILSLTQNVPQVVQMFGAWGGVLAAIITLLGTFTLVMVNSGKSLSDIAPFLGVTQEELAKLGQVVKMVQDLMTDFANVVINNLDVLLISATLLASYMGGQYVAKMILAGKATGFLTKSLGLLRAAIIRTGLGALVIGLGYLIERLVTLNKATGDWGKTFKLVGDVVKQTITQLPLFFVAFQMKAQAAIQTIGAVFLDVMASIVQSASTRINAIIGLFLGLGRSVKEVMDTVRVNMVNAIVDAINMQITKVQAGVMQMIQLFNRLPNINIPLTIPDLPKLQRLPDKVGKIGERVRDTFKTALSGDYAGPIADGLTSGAESARELAQRMSALGDQLMQSATGAIPAWQELKALLDSVATEQIDIRDLFKKQAKETTEKVKDKKPKVDIDTKPAKAKLTDLQKRIQDMGNAIGNTVKSNFSALIRGTQSLKKTLSNVLDQIADKLITFAIDGLFAAFTGGLGGGGFGANPTGNFFTNVLGNILSFNGGGYTGSGARAGGVDGRGGFPAILHPNETVIDHEKIKKGGTMGGPSLYQPSGSSAPITVVMNNHSYFNGVTREEVMRDVEQNNRQMEERMNRELPGKIDKHRFNQRRGMA